MKTPAITHRQLSLFRATMVHGSVSRAADVANTSQPTLSRELARLEHLLGYALFDRVRGRLQPTARALALMQVVERSFVGLEHIAQRAVALRTLALGQLRVACLPALASTLLPLALQRFAITQPDAQVGIEPLESPWLEQALREQRFDVGLSETTEAPAGVERRVLLRVNEVAVLPRQHHLAGKKALSLQDFANERFISLAADDPYRRTIDALFAQAGVARVQCLETTSAAAVCALVRRGLGVAIVNPLTAYELASAELVVRPLTEAIVFEVSLLLPHIAAPHPLRESLIAALVDAAGQTTD
jgi:DNA-binding transcriptional LysR family regulator